MWFAWVVAIAVSYLIGSIPIAYLLVKAKMGVDIRDCGSGNVGSANSWRVAGLPMGLITLLLDAGKGVLVAFAAQALAGPWVSVLMMAAAFFGHLYPVWLSFRGGKGVAIAFGFGLFHMPELALISLGVWLLLLLIFGYPSLSSCACAVLLALLSLFTAQPWPYMLAFAIFASMILVRHRSNFQRIAAGKERKTFRFQRERAKHSRPRKSANR